MLLAAGDLDPTFGVDGKVTTDFLGTMHDVGQSVVVVQGDGKIVVAGTSFSAGSDFALARYNPDGSLDSSFGTGGKVTTDFGSPSDGASGVAVQADGKIVAAGRTQTSGMATDIALARYNADGTLDSSFGSLGKVITDFAGGFDGASGVALQADGKIVVAGFSGSDFALARYNLDGSLDGGFGSGGRVTTDFGSFSDGASGVAVQADGKIVAAGNSHSGATSNDFALARYNADGSLDAGFGSGGKVMTDFSARADHARAVAVQADGKIIVVGRADNARTGTNFALARYHADGSLDNSFDGDGKVITPVGAFAAAFAVMLHADGRIVVAGEANAGSVNMEDFAVARYYADGSLDTSFDGDGIVTTNFGPGTTRDRGAALALQADGKIVAAGVTFLNPGINADIALARYSDNGSLDTSFDGDGKVTTGFIGSADDWGSDWGDNVVFQGDGKIIVVGSTYDANGAHFAVARYNRNGSLDTSFDGDGRVTTDFAGHAEAYSVALQADGKIVVVGHVLVRSTFSGNDFDFAVARYNPNGSLDTSFGSGGRVTTDFGPFSDAGTGVVLQPDGKIVVAGYTLRFVSFSFFSYDFALARYNADGSLDTTFDGDGKVTTDRGRDEQAFGVALQGDGKIVAAGRFGSAFGLARYYANGTLDASFGSEGTVTTDFGPSASLFDEHASSVVVQADGKIVAAGRAGLNFDAQDFALARYNPDGSLDASFGGDGMVTTDFANSTDAALSLVLQADGKIVAAGWSDQSATGYDFDFALARYNADGSLDTSLGSDGKVTTDFGSRDDYAMGVAIQADGKIVVAGSSDQGITGYDFALSRYLRGTPHELIEGIITNVHRLVETGVINHGQGNALLVKLQHAIQHLDNGNVDAAINSLQTFITQVNAFINAEILTPTEGQPLIDEAQVIIDQLGGSPLQVSGPVVDSRFGDNLSNELLYSVVDQAFALWSGAGVSADRLAALRDVEFKIDDLLGTRLGVATQGGTIWIDRDAAGHGWAIHPSDRGVDLLSVVAHELGHLLGFEHSADEGVMGEVLAPGQRRIPLTNDHLIAHSAFAASFLIHTLNAEAVAALLATDLSDASPEIGAFAVRQPSEAIESLDQRAAPLAVELDAGETLLSPRRQQAGSPADPLDPLFISFRRALWEDALEGVAGSFV